MIFKMQLLIISVEQTLVILFERVLFFLNVLSYMQSKIMQNNVERNKQYK